MTAYAGLAADTVWELTEGDPTPRRLGTPVAMPAGPARPRTATAPRNSRGGVVRFLASQRAAMDAMRRGELDQAIRRFREALAIDPAHEDARYYLGNCLAMMGDVPGALGELRELARRNPQSHRAHRQWGLLRLASAGTADDLDAAEAAVERALAINPEETGALLLLGEIALLRGRHPEADRYLALATRTNSQAVGGFFLRGYLAWAAGVADEAERLLARARAARGEAWVPPGSTSEGDVAARMHAEATPLSQYWEAWDEAEEPAAAFGPLDAHLAAVPW